MTEKDFERIRHIIRQEIAKYDLPKKKEAVEVRAYPLRDLPKAVKQIISEDPWESCELKTSQKPPEDCEACQ